MPHLTIVFISRVFLTLNSAEVCVVRTSLQGYKTQALENLHDPLI